MTKEFNKDNSIKAKSGSNNKAELLSLLNEFEKKFNNVHLSKNVKMGASGKDPNQFSVNAILKFDDQHEENWLIETSSSYRSDRVKGIEFDIEHIKELIRRPDVNVKAFFVVPDTENSGAFNKYKENVEHHNVVTYFDDILKFSEFRNIIAERCSKYLTQGIKANILGDEAEKDIAEAFNNSNNIELWNKTDNSKVIKSRNFDIIQSLMDKYYPNKQIKAMVAYDNNSKDSHYLADLNTVKDPNGGHVLGKPKTDILVIITFTDGNQANINFSVKHPKVKSKRVTAHEGDVDTLLNDLQASMPQDSVFNDPDKFNQLSTALHNFQDVGSAKNMTPDNRDFLKYNLSDLNSWLIDYFLFGINNRRLNKDQVANTMAIVNPENGNLIYLTRNEEKHLLLQYCQNHKPSSSSFGTPFSWTYPSKKRGKKIQIKSPLPL